jgi:DNA (cytosine-5)-methyltransferase 1
VRGLAWVVVRWAREAKPRIIILENVEEFQGWGPLIQARDPSGRALTDSAGRPVMLPDKSRRGQTFRRWVGQLRAAGYQVEWRELVAADYGVPTIRKRLFLIARRDGKPIRWPVSTHAPRAKAKAMNLPPWRAAAECIDWTLPCPSIFERKRPLAEATLHRIANGLRRYVLDASEPFIVTCNHAGPEFRGQSLLDPMRTLTGSRDACGLVTPYLAEVQNASGVHGCRTVNAPMATVTAFPRGGGFALVAPTLLTNTSGHAGGHVGDPVPTLTTGGHQALVAAFLNKHRGNSLGNSPHDPLSTITSGAGASRPAGAAHALGITSARLVTLPTSGSGTHVAEVRAFLVQYYGSGSGREGRSLGQPTPTITAKHRLGIVTVRGVDYQIADIGLRMLKPRELLQAQFGRFAAAYVLAGTQADQVAAIGNSVCPEMAEALVRANWSTQPRRRGPHRVHTPSNNR